MKKILGGTKLRGECPRCKKLLVGSNICKCSKKMSSNEVKQSKVIYVKGYCDANDLRKIANELDGENQLEESKEEQEGLMLELTNLWKCGANIGGLTQQFTITRK